MIEPHCGQAVAAGAEDIGGGGGADAIGGGGGGGGTGGGAGAEAGGAAAAAPAGIAAPQLKQNRAPSWLLLPHWGQNIAFPLLKLCNPVRR
jgi:hypothetical protein